LAELANWQYIALGFTFIWSGFVRSGLGFDGGALALPLMLLVLDDPVVLLPIIAVHLLIFASLTSARNLQNIDWAYLKKSLLIMAIPKIVGVIGLLLETAKAIGHLKFAPIKTRFFRTFT